MAFKSIRVQTSFDFSFDRWLKRGYIEKYVNIIYALGSAHVTRRYESKLIFCRSIRQAQSNRTAESTQMQKCRS